MFSRSQILTAAWAMYRRHFAARPHLKFKLDRTDFGFYLATAWRNAKASAMSLAERRTEALANQIEALRFKTLRYDTAPMRRALESQLSAVSA